MTKVSSTEKTYLKVELTPEQTEFIGRLGLIDSQIQKLVVRDLPSEVFQLILSHANLSKAAKLKLDLVGEYGDSVVNLDFKDQKLEKHAEFDPNEKYTTVTDAAKRMDTSNKSIYRWFVEGKLTKTKFMGKILVLESELAEIEKGREFLQKISDS